MVNPSKLATVAACAHAPVYISFRSYTNFSEALTDLLHFFACRPPIQRLLIHSFSNIHVAYILHNLLHTFHRIEWDFELITRVEHKDTPLL